MNNLYKQHKFILELEFENCPKYILDNYKCWRYIYVNHNNDFGEIPIEYELLKQIEKENYYNDIFNNYSKGFLKGYNEPLKPINNSTDWKQFVLNILGNFFLIGFKKNNDVPIEQRFEAEDCFQIGVREGKRYKAWDFIFENFKYFNEEGKGNSINLQRQLEIEKGIKKIGVNKIALIHAYNGKQITRENADGIAAQNGYTSKNSGEGLFQEYTLYCSRTNRIAKPFPYTLKKLKNKIQLFESIIEHLKDEAKTKVLDEIKILKIYLNDDFL